MPRRTQKRKNRSRKGGFTCPPSMSQRVCDKYKRLGLDPGHRVTGAFKVTLNNALRNRERRLMPEEQRVAEARNHFNYKSKRWRSHSNNNSNINNSNLVNVHEATNNNFPANTGETPGAFVGFQYLPIENTTIRKKVYKNNY